MDESPRTKVTDWSAVAGITETSARASQASVIGTPSTSTATWRDSDPRAEISASPRELVRTWRSGISRRSSSMDGAGARGRESTSASIAAAPPT